MVDPVLLATITSQVVTLAGEVAKAGASEAGKAAWHRVCSVFGWGDNPPAGDGIARSVAESLVRSESLVPLVQRALEPPAVAGTTD